MLSDRSVCTGYDENTFLHMAERVSVLIVAGLHSFLGDVENRGVRVLDVLNDDHTAFIHLHDVAVFRGFQGECLKRMSDATIPKRTIDFVMIESTVHEAPLRRKHGFIEKPAVGTCVDGGIRNPRDLYVKGVGRFAVDIASRDADILSYYLGLCQAFRIRGRIDQSKCLTRQQHQGLARAPGTPSGN